MEEAWVIRRVFYLLSVYVAVLHADCIIDRTNLMKKSPILLREHYDRYVHLNDAIYLPGRDEDSIVIRDHVKVYMACPGSAIKRNKMPTIKGTVAEFVCLHGSFSGSYFSDISCDDVPDYIIKSDGNKFQIGFQVGSKFLKHIDGVKSADHFTTLYTHHILNNGIKGLKQISSHFHFVAPRFTKCSECYTFKTQRDAIPKLVPTSKTTEVKGYFVQNTQYLARGHLTAHADFNFAYQQKATYPHHNCVPQWSQINHSTSGTWGKLEENIRSFAARRRHPLIIYTGTAHISQLFGEELFLSEPKGNGKIPVPRFMWKIVQDSRGGAAVAFVVSNNPYDYTESASFRCTDVCSSVSHLISTAGSDCARSYEKGCLYCCKVDDILRSSIPHIPIPNTSVIS